MKYSSTAGQGYNRDSFLTFDIRSLSTVGQAELQLNGDVNNSDVLSVGAYAQPSAWGQSTITWNTQPASATLQSVTIVAGTTARWFQWDVTSLVRQAKAAGASTVSIELAGTTSTGGYGDFVASTGGSSGPQLVVSTSDASLAPAADSYVQDGTSANTNYGSATQLLTKKTSSVNNRNAFVTFDTTNVTGPVTNAFLQLTGGMQSGGTDADVPVYVYPVAATSWGENTITWNNQPAAGTTALATAVDIDPTTRLYTWDVSSYVNQQRAAGHPVVSFMVQPEIVTSTSVMAFNSKEASSGTPQLVLSETPTPTPTPTPAPTVAVPATATQDPDEVGGIELQALGNYATGESNLTYTWACTSAPSGSSVNIIENGTHEANSTYADVTQAGTYAFQVTISSGSGSVTSSTSLTIAQTPKGITVNTSGGLQGDALSWGQQAQFVAAVNDQFGNPINSPSLNWSVGGAGGTIDSTGTYTAPSSGVGTDTVGVTDGSAAASLPVEVGNITGQVTDSGDLGYGQPGWQVYLDQNGNGVFDSGEPETTTDANGFYGLPAPAGSCQQVLLFSRIGWEPNPGGEPLTSGDVTNPGKNFKVQPAIRTITSNDNSLTVLQGQPFSEQFHVTNGNQAIGFEAAHVWIKTATGTVASRFQFDSPDQHLTADANGNYTFRTDSYVSGGFTIEFDTTSGLKTVSVTVEPAKVQLVPDPGVNPSNPLNMAITKNNSTAVYFQVVSAVLGSNLEAPPGTDVVGRIEGGANIGNVIAECVSFSDQLNGFNATTDAYGYAEFAIKSHVGGTSKLYVKVPHTSVAADGIGPAVESTTPFEAIVAEN